MPQNPRRTRQLLKQYPFLEDIYVSEVEAAPLGCEVWPVIAVKRADNDLMFRRADNVSGAGHYLADPERPDLIGTRYEYYYPVSRSGQLGKIRHWPADETQYVRDLFLSECRDWVESRDALTGEDPFDVVDGIVWVTRQDWYPAGSNLSRTFHGARPVRRNLWITLHREPRQGWRQLHRTADILVNVTLQGYRLTAGPVRNEPFRAVVYARLDKLGRDFQEKVWRTGLGEIINGSSMRGMSGNFGTVRVLSFITAGRMQIQLERGGASFVLGGLDNLADPAIGFFSISGTLRQAERMVEDVIKFWEGADDNTRRTVYQDNANVGIGF